MAATRRNTARVELRLPRETKPRWEQAAELADEESAWLHACLGEPVREPMPAMRRAAQRHRSLFGHD